MLAEDSLKQEKERKFWSYELVDALLNKIDQKGGDSIGFSTHTLVGKMAITIIKDESLAMFSSSFLPGAILTISQNGKNVIAAGGIENYIKFWGINKSNKIRK